MKTSQRIIESSAHHSKHHHNTMQTTLTSASTTSTDNSAFINKFISQNETLKQIASSSNVIKHCCKQFPSNVNNIFSSDKRKAQVLSYLKKLHHNNTQTQSSSKTNVRLFNVSPIRAAPIIQHKNVPMTSRNDQSVKSNMFTTYTSRVPLHVKHCNDMYDDNEHQRTQTISLAGDTKRECLMKEKETTLLDKLSILDNSNYSDYCIEQGEISFDEDNNHDIQLLYTKNERNVKCERNNKRMKNGCVITVIENGNCVKEYECPREGDVNVNAMNEMLRKEKVSFMNKILQFVGLNEYEQAMMSLKESKNKKCNWLSLLSHERAVNITYVNNSKRNKNKLKKQLTSQFEYSPVKVKKRNKGVNTTVFPLQSNNNIQLSLLNETKSFTEIGINTCECITDNEQHSLMHTQDTDQCPLLEHSALTSEHTLEQENELRNAKQHKSSLYVIPNEEIDVFNMSITNSQIRNCISFSDLFSKDKGMQKDGNAMRSKAMLFRKKFKRYYERQQHS